MSEPGLTTERILEAAEDVLRRFGPAKANVVDVARALGVSHGSVYRYFPSKAALRDAVTERWLARVLEPLTTLVAADAPASERLHDWLAQLISIKRSRALDDPELFATYLVLTEEARHVVSAHVDHMAAQVAQIIADGIARGEFVAVDPPTAARAVLDATSRFHKPAYAAEWADPQIDAAFAAVWSLIVRGLRR